MELSLHDVKSFVVDLIELFCHVFQCLKSRLCKDYFIEFLQCLFEQIQIRYQLFNFIMKVDSFYYMRLLKAITRHTSLLSQTLDGLL